jgi:hypothetical protein
MKEQFLKFHNIYFAAPTNVVIEARFKIKSTKLPGRTSNLFLPNLLYLAWLSPVQLLTYDTSVFKITVMILISNQKQFYFKPHFIS